MAVSKTSKMRNRYIEFRQAGNPPIESARLAGYSSPGSNYQKIEEHPDVQAVVKAMAEEEENKTLYTKKDAINDLKEGIKFARLKGDGMALKNCVAELAKLLEFYKPEPKETKGITPNKRKQAKDLELMTEDELLEKLGGDGSVTLEGEFKVEDDEESLQDV